MLNLKTRPYQKKAITSTLKAVANGQDRGLWVMPTGVGKTHTACEVMRCLNVPTLFLVHREELITQTIATLGRLWKSCKVGVVKAERNEWDADVVIASVQSLNEARLSQVDPNRFGLVIPDECHHAPAMQWTRALSYFQSGFRLGMTATPDRLDGKGLADLFGPEPLFTMSILDAIMGGWLVNIRQYAIKTDIELDHLPTRGGDFVEDALDRAVNTEARNKVIVDAYRKHGESRRAIAFCVTVEHARTLAQAFADDNIPAAVIHGGLNSIERQIILEGFREGAFKVVTSVAVLTEGFDDPGIECVLMARPTQSRCFYTQAIGRGLRLNPGKKDCLILDITDNCKRHKLIAAPNLLGSQRPDAEGELLTDVLAEEEAEESARQELIRDHILGPVTWRLESVCPWPGLPSLEGWQDSLSWHHKPASEKQLNALRRFGLGVQVDLTCGQASCLLDQCFALEDAYPTPATARQEYALRYAGLWVEGMTKREAGKLIGEMKRTQGEEG